MNSNNCCMGPSNCCSNTDNGNCGCIFIVIIIVIILFCFCSNKGNNDCMNNLI